MACVIGTLPAERVSIDRALDESGFATVPDLLDARDCAALASMYVDESRFRSRVDMARFRFGVGEYQFLRRAAP